MMPAGPEHIAAASLAYGVVALQPEKAPKGDPAIVGPGIGPALRYAQSAPLPCGAVRSWDQPEASARYSVSIREAKQQRDAVLAAMLASVPTTTPASRRACAVSWASIWLDAWERARAVQPDEFKLVQLPPLAAIDAFREDRPANVLGTTLGVLVGLDGVYDQTAAALVSAEDELSREYARELRAWAASPWTSEPRVPGRGTQLTRLGRAYLEVARALASLEERDDLDALAVLPDLGLKVIRLAGMLELAGIRPEDAWKVAADQFRETVSDPGSYVGKAGSIAASLGKSLGSVVGNAAAGFLMSGFGGLAVVGVAGYVVLRRSV